MSESSSSKSIVVIFVPFDGSPKDFTAKLREWVASLELRNPQCKPAKPKSKELPPKHCHLGRGLYRIRARKILGS